jgi:hypothetical protein
MGWPGRSAGRRRTYRHRVGPVHNGQRKKESLMIRMLRRASLVVAAVVLVAAGAAAQGSKVDLTGEWLFSVQTDAGTGEPTVTFKQDGEKLTGHYSSQTLGEADLTGTVKGAAIEFSFTANVQGNALPVKYTGSVESNTSLKGTLTITGLGNGTFTAKRK